ncbi:MAG: ATP synthase subunit C [Verrucomicrobiota bacterium]
MDNPAQRLKKNIKGSVAGMLGIMAIVSVIFCTNTFAADGAGHGEDAVAAAAPAITEVEMGGLKFAVVAASVAFGLGALGAGIAISHVGAAAMGAVAEKPQIAGQALIFVALAEGIVVFGFITALMILGKV